MPSLFDLRKKPEPNGPAGEKPANPFLAQAESAIPKTVQKATARKELSEARKIEKAMKMLSPLEKKRKETQELMKLYNRWRRGLSKDLKERHGAELVALVKFLRTLSADGYDRLVEACDKDWLRQADEKDKFYTLGLIGQAVIRSRVRDGRSPIDDGIPGIDPPGVFVQVRRVLTGV